MPEDLLLKSQQDLLEDLLKILQQPQTQEEDHLLLLSSLLSSQLLEVPLLLPQEQLELDPHLELLVEDLQLDVAVELPHHLLVMLSDPTLQALRQPPRL